MDFVSKLKETLISVLPIAVVVLILNFTVCPLNEMLFPFIIGTILLVIGLTVFLSGTDIGMVPIGEKLGSTLAHKKNLTLMLVVGFLVGFGVTFAEPDVNVLASQVHAMNSQINSRLLVFFIATGLGIFVDIGLLRSVLKINLKWVFLLFYLIVFAVVSFIGQDMVSISFDASGATTGPLAVPFLLALGLGVSSASQNSQDNSFGLTGISSIGPILAVALMASFSSKSSGAVLIEASTTVFESFSNVLVSQIKNTAIGFLPLALIIIVLQFVLLHFPKIRFRKILLGMAYSFIGIVLFLTGVEYGFSEVGKILGKTLMNNFGPGSCIILALVFGAIVVCAEPAVWVLTQQIEQVSVGRIKKRQVMVFLCLGVAFAVSLAILRIIFNINYLYFVYIGIGLSLILSFFCPSLFTGIAFDSGGVASGPMSTTFLLSFAMGVSQDPQMGFGLVGLIAISPLISIQILGIIYRMKENKIKRNPGGVF